MLQVAQHFAQGEKADQHRHHLKAVKQLGDAEGEPFDAEGGVQTHGVEQQAEQAGDQGLLPVFAAQGGHGGQSHDAQRKILAGPELRQGHREEHENEDTQHAAEHRRPQADTHGLARPALFEQRIAVKGRHGSGGSARGVDGHGGDGAAVVCADVNAHQHDQGHRRAHGIGHGQQQGHGHRRADARNGAAQDTHAHADEDPEDGLQVQHLAEAHHQIIEYFTHSSHLP